MRFVFRLMFLGIIFSATQISASETVMICNADRYEKRFYKLNAPFFGEKTVEQKIDGKWNNWCKQYCAKIEIYESGAMQQTERFFSWDQSYPDEGIVAGRKYFIVGQYWIDFEFGRRKVKRALYTDKSKRTELTNWEGKREDTYSCEIQGNTGYLKKFKGTIEGVFE